MGRATIEECKSLLRYLNERGYGPLGMSGLSQGGIYAAFVGTSLVGVIRYHPQFPILVLCSPCFLTLA